jgi:transglutaminase-like putative cysteine protease
MNRLQLHFRVWTHLWVFCGFLALIWTDDFGAGLLALALIAVCLSPAAEKLSDRFPRYRKLWTIASFAYLLVIPFDLVVSDLVFAVIHLLIFIQVVKLLNKKTNKDYVHMYLMCFFQLLAASVLAPGALFSVALVLFLVAAVWSLTLFHLKVESETASRLAHGQPEGTAGMGLARGRRLTADRASIIDTDLIVTTTALALTAVLLTSGLFYAVPRFESGFLSRPRQFQQVGFTEEVELATFGRVFSDSTVVMKVEMPEFPGGYPGELYWRAMALDYYDGRRWLKIRPRRDSGVTRTFEFSRDGDGVFEPRALPPDMDLVEQVVYLDLDDTTYLFGLPDVKRMVGDFDAILWDRYDESWSLPRLWQGSLRYRVYSLPPRFTPEELRGSSVLYPPGYVRYYVEQLPANLDSRIYSLAADITKRATNPYDKAVAVQAYLRKNYLYRLTALSDRSEAPLEEFLLTTRAGHCEFFATAMAVLLRCAGVPARIASGFRGGEWNEFGGFYAIRQDFAHVWTEVLFPDVGWVAFDPSPAAPDTELPRSWWLATKSFLSQYTLALQMKWYKYVIGFDQNNQWAVVRTVRGGIREGILELKDALVSAVRNSRLVPTGLWRPLAITVYLGAVGYLVLLVRRYFSARRRRVLAGITGALPRSKRRAAALYSDMLFAYARRGIVKDASHTPLEFLSHLLYRPVPERQLATELTGLYYRTRFGDYSFGKPDERRFREMLKRLEHMLRR